MADRHETIQLLRRYPWHLLPKADFLRAVATALLVTWPVRRMRPLNAATTSSGFPEWIQEYKQEAQAQGIGSRGIRALDNVTYASKTINADRNMKSFKYSLDKFMQVRGAQTIVSRGKKQKAQNAALFDRIEQRYGVPAGPLIGDMGHGNRLRQLILGSQNTLSAVATLAYDCRRPDYFRPHLNAALATRSTMVPFLPMQ